MMTRIALHQPEAHHLGSAGTLSASPVRAKIATEARLLLSWNLNGNAQSIMGEGLKIAMLHRLAPSRGSTSVTIEKNSTAPLLADQRDATMMKMTSTRLVVRLQVVQ